MSTRNENARELGFVRSEAPVKVVQGDNPRRCDKVALEALLEYTEGRPGKTLQAVVVSPSLYIGKFQAEVLAELAAFNYPVRDGVALTTEWSNVQVSFITTEEAGFRLRGTEVDVAVIDSQVPDEALNVTVQRLRERDCKQIIISRKACPWEVHQI